MKRWLGTTWGVLMPMKLSADFHYCVPVWLLSLSSAPKSGVESTMFSKKCHEESQTSESWLDWVGCMASNRGTGGPQVWLLLTSSHLLGSSTLKDHAFYLNWLLLLAFASGWSKGTSLLHLTPYVLFACFWDTLMIEHTYIYEYSFLLQLENECPGAPAIPYHLQMNFL